MPKNKFDFENPIENVFDELSSNQDTQINEKLDENPERKTHKTPQIAIPKKLKQKLKEKDRELKQKRRNLLILPSLYKEIEKIAYVEKISANEAINQAIELYCKRNKTKLGLYAKIEEIKATNDSEKNEPE